MTKRVAVYARVSTSRQAENDISIPDQLAHAQRFCADRKWHVVREFVDAGASARDDKRQDFQTPMDLACIDPSPFDVVLFHSQSRFFRDVAGYTFWKHKLLKHGVSLLSITQGFGEGPSADFAETILAAADQYTSAETAKHVTRTMLENARQGFWNGSRPPFGYRTIDVEKRGQRIKKHLEIEPKAAEIVRLMFKLCIEGDGTSGPLGVKSICDWLNSRGLTNGQGKQFYVGTLHKMLTQQAYMGVYYYNCRDSRTRKPRPKEEWIAIAVPAIISAEDFQTVRERLHKRRPSMTPPRISTSNVLLTGIVRCESCGGGMMIRTGKGGRYRYYACAGHRLRGAAACSNPIAVPEAHLNGLVLGALADQLLTPERLPVLLFEAHRHRRSLACGNAQRRHGLRKRIKDTEIQIKRLYAAIADGAVTVGPLLRESLSALEARREESIRLLSLLDIEVPPLRRCLSKAQARAVAATLKRRLIEAPPPMQRRYLHGLVSDIVVDREKAMISGSRDAVAAAIAAGTPNGEVRTSVREWRARRDSNS